MHPEIQTQKGPNERLFILTRTHSMQIFRELPFIKPQNGTQTTDKRSKTMKNERKRLISAWLTFHSLFGAWKVQNASSYSVTDFCVSGGFSSVCLCAEAIHHKVSDSARHFLFIFFKLA